METRNETIHEQGKLKRKLGLGAALAVAVGTTIGSGIFSSLAEVAGASGSALMMIVSFVMEGAGPITGPALMAEIGDVRRFKNKKALVAFAGIDAPPFQSGAFESKSRHVSKRGSPHLRRTIFIVSNIILTRSNPENAVYCFMDKKRSEGKHYYVYTVAGSAKFLRVYYARVTEFLRSQPSPGAC